MLQYFANVWANERRVGTHLDYLKELEQGLRAE